MIEVLNDILSEIQGVLENVTEEEMTAFLEGIQPGRRVFVDGEGRSGFSARGFAMRLMHLGYTVFFVGETVTPAVKEGDIFIGVSGSGSSINVVNDTKKAREKGASVLAVTSKADSPLAAEAETVLIIPGTVRGDSGQTRASIQLLSSLFDQSLHIVLDAACLLISRRDNISNDKATGGHW